MSELDCVRQSQEIILFIVAISVADVVVAVIFVTVVSVITAVDSLSEHCSQLPEAQHGTFQIVILCLESAPESFFSFGMVLQRKFIIMTVNC